MTVGEQLAHVAEPGAEATVHQERCSAADNKQAGGVFWPPSTTSKMAAGVTCGDHIAPDRLGSHGSDGRVGATTSHHPPKCLGRQVVTFSRGTLTGSVGDIVPAQVSAQHVS